MWLGRVTYDHLLPLHKRQCLVTTNLPSLHPFSFHEMIFMLVYIDFQDKEELVNLEDLYILGCICDCLATLSFLLIN